MFPDELKQALTSDLYIPSGKTVGYVKTPPKNSTKNVAVGAGTVSTVGNSISSVSIGGSSIYVSNKIDDFLICIDFNKLSPESKKSLREFIIKEVMPEIKEEVIGNE